VAVKARSSRFKARAAEMVERAAGEKLDGVGGDGPVEGSAEEAGDRVRTAEELAGGGAVFPLGLLLVEGAGGEAAGEEGAEHAGAGKGVSKVEGVAGGVARRGGRETVFERAGEEPIEGELAALEAGGEVGLGEEEVERVPVVTLEAVFASETADIGEAVFNGVNAGVAAGVEVELNGVVLAAADMGLVAELAAAFGRRGFAAVGEDGLGAGVAGFLAEAGALGERETEEGVIELVAADAEGGAGEFEVLAGLGPDEADAADELVAEVAEGEEPGRGLGVEELAADFVAGEFRLIVDSNFVAEAQ
jgi:hypothetical protein